MKSLARQIPCLRRRVWVKYQRYCLGVRLNFLNELQRAHPKEDFRRSYARLNKWKRWIDAVERFGRAW